MGVEQGLLALIGAADVGGYEIEQSVKFDSARSANLSRTPSSTGNRRTYTVSCWVKRAQISATQMIWSAGPASGGNIYLYFTSTDELQLSIDTEATGIVKTNAKYRDPGAWYHIVCVVDTTEGPAANRIKFFVNGEAVTSFASASYPSQGHETHWNHTSGHRIGRRNDGTAFYLNGYIAEFYNLDDTAVTDALGFGEYDANGVWRPKRYTGSYTGNSFYLKFEQGALGTDSSGLGNDWIPNELWEEIGTPDYANNWIGSTSGSFYSGSWENVFNGDVTVGSNYIYAYNNTATLTFSTALSGVIEVFGSDGGDGSGTSGSISLSDGSSWSISGVARANATWHSFGSKSNITTITVSSPGGNGAILGAIRVDGNLLANISAKANYVNMADTPTKNWCTLNPLDNGGNTVSNGNLVVNTSAGFDLIRSTFFLSSGKWYWEVTADDGGEGFVGISSAAESLSTRGAETANSATIRTTNGNIRTSGSDSSYGSAVSDGDVMMFALDMDAGKFWAGKGGTWFNSGDPAAGTNAGKTGLTEPVSPSISLYDNEDYIANFGQRDFEYTPPTGFKALNTSNLPAPDIADGSDYVQTVLDTGANILTSAQSAFTNGLWWIKDRANANQHQLVDSVRGGNEAVWSPSTAVAGTYSAPSGNSVAWCWSASNTFTPTQTGGLTSLSGARNTQAGFSIVSYTGSGVPASFTHGLNQAPEFFFIMPRTLSGQLGAAYHSSAGAGNVAFLRQNYGFNNASYWGSGPSGTSITIDTASTATQTNNLNDDYVCYAWHSVPGYSKFGQYTGNGLTDGPFVYCGFRPAFLLIKGRTGSANWEMVDNTRNAHNVINEQIFANLTTVYTNYTFGDFVSNGFKIRDNSSGLQGNYNTSGAAYVFAAFAENPFGGFGISPATAR